MPRDPTSCSPRAGGPQAKGSIARAQKGSADLLMFWIDVPQETEQLRARRRGFNPGPYSTRILAEFMRGLDQVAGSPSIKSRYSRSRYAEGFLDVVRTPPALAPPISLRQMFVKQKVIKIHRLHDDVFQRLLSTACPACCTKPSPPRTASMLSLANSLHV